MSEVAVWASRKGHHVLVYTADRGYEDPHIRFSPYEVVRGVEIVRLKWSSLGKRRFVTRLLGQIGFSLQTLIRGLGCIRPDAILISTTPPFGIAAAWLLSKLRNVPLMYWVMDINPDQAIVMGMVGRGSLAARVMEKLNRLVLGSAKVVVTLDSYMAGNLGQKAPTRRPILIIPPWPHEEALNVAADRGRRFREIHHLEDKFIVMYSGNHSWVHPLDTVLRAAKDLEERKDILFLFIGQGNEKVKVREAIRLGAQNILSLPFQPLEDLGETLAAADAQLVVMGDAMVGIVHPSKIYNAMAVEKPILAVAPRICYLSEMLDGNRVGFRFDHGDSTGLARGILSLADMTPKERADMGRRAGALVRGRWNQADLMNRLLGALEDMEKTGESRYAA